MGGSLNPFHKHQNTPIRITSIQLPTINRPKSKKRASSKAPSPNPPSPRPKRKRRRIPNPRSRKKSKSVKNVSKQSPVTPIINAVVTTVDTVINLCDDKPSKPLPTDLVLPHFDLGP